MFYCGIDIGKRKHAVALLDERGKPHKAVFTIENTRAGLDVLVDELRKLGDEAVVGLEATGHYWLALYDGLSRQGFALAVINPLQVSAYRKRGVRKVKNDRIDAIWIADFVRTANPPTTRQEMSLLLQLRELSRFRGWLSEQIGGCKRKVIAMLEKVFPEYESLFSSVFVQSSRALLQEAASAHDFAAFDLHELTEKLAKTSRSRFGEEKARQVMEQARQSIGIQFLAGAALLEMRCLLAQLELLEEQIAEVEKAQAELMETIPQHITSIRGIALPTGATILGEIGDVRRFESVDKVVAYAGIDAAVYESGQFHGTEMHMSKRGSPYLRLALWQAASMAIQHNDELKAYYYRKRAEGKAHGTALGAVCRKLLARIYVVLKENRPYEIRGIA